MEINLTTLANKYGSDKGTTQGSCHGFSNIYDEYLSTQKNKIFNVLEIVINNGSSLKMWYNYFPNAIIHGLDIDNKSQYNNDRIKCTILDQSNEEQLKQFSETVKIQYDFIIDDGSHHMRDQQITFGYLFKLLKPGGIYVIEDLHTSLCDNGTNVYGRPVEIYNDCSNTTYNYLQKKTYDSVYLSQEQNNYLQNSIDKVLLYKRPNDKVPVDYKGMSITSLIWKKY